MNELKLKIYPNKNLNVICDEIIDFDFELDVLCGQMLAIMKSFEGLGLAANQVGIHKRIFVFENNAVDGIERPYVPDVFINPEIIEIPETTERYFKEGCLSFPGSYVKVLRKEHFILKYKDQTGEEQELGPDICCGIFGHAFQHEIDHLNGVTLLEKVNSFEKTKILNKINKLRRKK